MATRKRTEKKVQLIARVTFKNNPAIVTYLVRSSNGSDVYQTTLYNGKVSGCSCKATKPCYHMVQVQSIESKRQEELAAAASLAPALVSDTFAQDIEQHIEDELDGHFESQAEAILEEERVRLAALEAGRTIEQERQLERTRYTLEQNRKQAEWRKARNAQPPLQPGNGVEETEFGMVPMRRTA